MMRYSSSRDQKNELQSCVDRRSWDTRAGMDDVKYDRCSKGGGSTQIRRNNSGQRGSRWIPSSLVISTNVCDFASEEASFPQQKGILLPILGGSSSSARLA